jgi:hypothetical protein
MSIELKRKVYLFLFIEIQSIKIWGSVRDALEYIIGVFSGRMYLGPVEHYPDGTVTLLHEVKKILYLTDIPVSDMIDVLVRLREDWDTL